MTWNDAIQQLAETHWSLGNTYDESETHPFIDKNLRGFIFATQRKLIPGYRFFSCNECGTHWNEKSRDCRSPSGDICPKCGEFSHPFNNEEHPEWPVDKSGNLV